VPFCIIDTGIAEQPVTDKADIRTAARRAILRLDTLIMNFSFDWLERKLTWQLFCSKTLRRKYVVLLQQFFS